MSLYSFLLDNKYILELSYALLLTFICAVIFFRTDKFFRLSLHKGLRYFRNAFLFYGAAFITRYLFGVLSDLNFDYAYIVKIIFEYFFVMAAFFLLYSLMWKKFETQREKHSSLFNPKIAIFHVLALVIAMMDYLWGTYYFLFGAEILIFIIASALAYSNYRKDRGQHKFLKFYFFAMILSLAAWVLNFLAESYFNWNHNLLIDVGIIDVIFFLLFLYGVVKATKQNGNKET